jgi:DNA-binding transcriptional LysR family regulator
LVVWAQRILADHDAPKAEVAALRSGLTGELRLGVIPNASTTVADLVSRFCAAHPLAHVQLATNLSSAEISNQLRRFELDAGVVCAEAVPAGDFVATAMYDERLMFVASTGMIGEAEHISWADAARLPLCLHNPSMRGRQISDATFAAQRLRIVSHVETGSVEALFAHAATGQWASIVSDRWVSAAAPRDSLGTVIRPECADGPGSSRTPRREPGRLRGRQWRRGTVGLHPRRPIREGLSPQVRPEPLGCAGSGQAAKRMTIDRPVGSGGADPTASLEFERSRGERQRDSERPLVELPGEDLEGSVTEGVHGILQRKSTGFLDRIDAKYQHSIAIPGQVVSQEGTSHHQLARRLLVGDPLLVRGKGALDVFQGGAPAPREAREVDGSARVRVARRPGRLSVRIGGHRYGPVLFWAALTLRIPATAEAIGTTTAAKANSRSLASHLSNPRG